MHRKRKNLSQPVNKTLMNFGIKRHRIDRNENVSKLDESNEELKGRAGRILRIYLRNFMCHSSLEVDFNPNTNFIIGRNGSGKSAILTALVVGLGGKARITNRGTSMKGFIKTGEASASIEITLTNTGPMAYNPKVFGNTILINRNFTETSNNYKIKNSQGQLVSSSFKDVCKIIEYLNIQIDNPVCLLNQDVARTFLNTNDPKKKYIMFMKATNLENLKTQISIIKKNVKDNKNILTAKRQNLKKFGVEVKKALDKHNAHLNLQNIVDRRELLNREVIWANINVIEESLAQKQSTVEELTNQLQHYSDLVENKDVHRKSLEENIQQIKQQLLEIRNEEEINQKEMSKKQKELNTLRESIFKLNSELSSLEAYIQRKHSDKKSIEEEINNSSEHQKNRMILIQKRDENMAKLEEKLLEINKLIETCANDLNQTNEALKLKQKEQADLNTEFNEISNKNRQQQSRIRSLKADENNSISVYGPAIQRILRCINASKEQFIKLPKGPIGSYIKLKNKQWSLAIEDFLSASLLLSFCVDNHKDSTVLSKIIEEVCEPQEKPAIIISKFYDKVHDYSANLVQVPSGCFALIDSLIVNDAVIKNTLIDQLMIENVLLFPSNEMARDLMSNKEKVPKNCTRAITINGDQFYPDPNYRTYSCRYKNAKFLQVNVADLIRMYENELKNSLQNQSVIEKQLQAVTKDVEKLTNEAKNLENRILQYEKIKMKTNNEIRELKLQVLPPELNIKILMEEIEEISKIIETKNKELEKYEDNKQEIKQNIKEVEKQYNDLKQVSRDLEQRMNPLIDQLREAEMNLNKLNLNTKFNVDKVKQFKMKIKTASQELEAKQKILNEKLSSASALGPRIDTNRDCEGILEEIRSLEEQIRIVKESMGDIQNISLTYFRLQEKYDKTYQEINQVLDCLDKFLDTLGKRKHNYVKLSEYIEIRIQEMFTGVLGIRQFKGSLTIDHVNQTLDMIVYPQHGAKETSGRTHTLSGGERSYSTVSFLHALWQVMEYPFYFLDEFDVFMDKVNRRTVMDILIAHATEHINLQYVFLTPQDISGVVKNDNVSIYRMADPTRVAIRHTQE